jgi:hypothetical protein
MNRRRWTPVDRGQMRLSQPAAASMGTIDPNGRGRQLAGPQNPQNLSHLEPLERTLLPIHFEDARRERPRNEETVSQPSCPRVRLFMDAHLDSQKIPQDTRTSARQAN